MEEKESQEQEEQEEHKEPMFPGGLLGFLRMQSEEKRSGGQRWKMTGRRRAGLGGRGFTKSPQNRVQAKMRRKVAKLNKKKATIRRKVARRKRRKAKRRQK